MQLKITGVYKYYDVNGELAYLKERIEPGRNGQKKEFMFFHMDNGQKVKGRGGDPVLYHLLDVIRSKYVIINEGEKQADLLKSWGLCATSLDSGAGSRITQSIIDVLTGKRIAILRDNDKPGLGYAEKIAEALNGKFESLRIVLLPELPDKGDVCDWKGDKKQLLEIIKSIPEWKPEPKIEKEKKIAHVNKCDKITDEMIESAKLYPIDKLIKFTQGKAFAFCHDDKTPSLTLNLQRNKCRCYVCGKSFSTIDILVERDNKSFIEAVKELQ